jgi:hypothetical protein
MFSDIKMSIFKLFFQIILVIYERNYVLQYGFETLYLVMQDLYITVKSQCLNTVVTFRND